MADVLPPWQWLDDQSSVNRGIIEIIGLLVEHLAERTAVDRGCLRHTLEARIAVWIAPTPDRPGGRNPRRAEPLQILAALLSPPAAPSDDKVH
jgi:hypothetical protein